jgi:hypothetical protein
VDIELRRYLALIQGRTYNVNEQDGLGRIRTGGLRCVRAETIGENMLSEYLDTLELSGITFKHKMDVKYFFEKYLNYINSRIDKIRSMTYF